MLHEQSGELVAVLRGANAPLLQRMIVEELAKEKLVLEQGGERKAVSHSHTQLHSTVCCSHMLILELTQWVFFINFDLS